VIMPFFIKTAKIMYKKVSSLVSTVYPMLYKPTLKNSKN